MKGVIGGVDAGVAIVAIAIAGTKIGIVVIAVEQHDPASALEVARSVRRA